MSKTGCVGCVSLPKCGRILLITQRHLSAAQASSSFECPAHAIPTFVTEALHLVACVRLFLNDCESEVMAYTALVCS